MMFVSICQSILRLPWRIYSLMQTIYDFQRSYGLIRHKFLYLPKTEILLGTWLYVRICLYRASLCRWRSSKQPIVCIVLSYVRGDLPTADWLYRAVLCTWRPSDSRLAVSYSPVYVGIFRLAVSCCPVYMGIFRQPTGCIVLSCGRGDLPTGCIVLPCVHGDLPTADWLYRAVLCTWRSSDSRLAVSCCPMHVEIFRQPTGCIVLSYARGDLPTADCQYRAVLCTWRSSDSRLSVSCCPVGDLTALLPHRKKSCCGFLSPLKVHRYQPCLNPRTLGPVASTITITPPRMTYLDLRRLN
jgi:hypothetical protein